MSGGELYHTMVQTILPRPVAWILSENENGRYNLAPYSFFNGVSSSPPLVMISIGDKRDGSPKDTRKNILDRSHFVIHIPHTKLAAAVTESSAPLPYGESELELSGLETVAFEGFPVPRLAEARIAFACTHFRSVEIPEAKQILLLGKIVQFYLDDSIASLTDGRLTIDPVRLDPLARLGGELYASLGRVIEIPKPQGS